MIETKRDTHKEWVDQLPVVRIELQPDSVLTRVYVNGEEWSASVKRISADVDDGATIVTMAFYAKVTAEGPLALDPWPILVENKADRPDKVFANGRT